MVGWLPDTVRSVQITDTSANCEQVLVEVLRNFLIHVCRKMKGVRAWALDQNFTIY